MDYDYSQLKQVARDYLQARHKFLTQSASYPELAGNDNLMGRIGEMIAVQFLRSQGRTVDKYEAANHAITDLRVIEADNKEVSVSVKLISAENKLGRTTVLKHGWDEFILVELQPNYDVKRLGWLDRKNLASDMGESFSQSAPITTRRMLDPDGLIGRFGRVYSVDNDAALLKALL
jgi:hypothetical protein